MDMSNDYYLGSGERLIVMILVFDELFPIPSNGSVNIASIHHLIYSSSSVMMFAVADAR